MDPLTLGLVLAVGAGGTAAVVRWRRERSSHPEREGRVGTVRKSLGAGESLARRDGPFGDLRVGDVLTHLGETFWLAGELSLIRDGSPTLRLFTAPEQGTDRWVGIPRTGDGMYVLHTDKALAQLGWPGLEVPLGGLVLRPLEHGACAVAPHGEVSSTWEGLGRYSVFRAMDTVAVVLEQNTQRLALSGKIVSRRLVEKLRG